MATGVERAAASLLPIAEKLNWLRLLRTPNIGPVTFHQLLAHFGGATAAINALPGLVSAGSRIAISSIPSLSAAEAELEKAQAEGMALHAVGEPDYPPLLARVEVPPPLIYMKGTNSCWNRPPIAIVGSRHASAAGLKFAAEISAGLCEAGFCIVSGLARGIDAAAHRAALSASTVAVLPGGLDVIYPPEHAALAQQIQERGALIGECPPGFLARAQDFPRRNRIISGCCLGVVVVEAAERSGSLITARLAAEQNREVFAVPGHPFEPRAAGTNGLIKDGAILTVSARDVVEALQGRLSEWSAPSFDFGCSSRGSLGVFGGQERSKPTEASEKEAGLALAETDSLLDAARDLLKILSFSPVDIDELARLTGSEPRRVTAALLILDLQGRIERQGQRYVTLKP